MLKVFSLTRIDLTISTTSTDEICPVVLFLSSVLEKSELTTDILPSEYFIVLCNILFHCIAEGQQQSENISGHVPSSAVFID